MGDFLIDNLSTLFLTHYMHFYDQLFSMGALL